MPVNNTRFLFNHAYIYRDCYVFPKKLKTLQATHYDDVSIFLLMTYPEIV